MTIKMRLEKETKGSVRYAEEGAPETQVLRTIYVRKTAFKGEAFPKQIVIDVKWIGAEVV